MSIKTITGKAKIGKIRKTRKLLKAQVEKMSAVLDIDLQEKWRLFSSEFSIEVSGPDHVVDYWCTTPALQLNNM